MNSGFLSVGSSPEELDKLIQSFEFENQHIVKFIEKENQLLEALQNEISEKKESIGQLQESTSQLDEETKRAHKQFKQNRDNCESLRKTASVLLDHEVALMKKMNSVVLTGEQERADRKNVLKHYRGIWEDYKDKYESFPLAKTYQEKKEQLDTSSAKLVEVSDKIQELKTIISNLRGSDMDVFDMKKFLVSVAELKLGTEKNCTKIAGLREDKAQCEKMLRDIEQRRHRQAKEKARLLEQKRQQEIALQENEAREREAREREAREREAREREAQEREAREREAREREAREREAREREAREMEARKMEARKQAQTANVTSARQVLPGQTARRPVTTPNQEYSTLSHMYGSEKSLVLGQPQGGARLTPQSIRPPASPITPRPQQPGQWQQQVTQSTIQCGQSYSQHGQSYGQHGQSYSQGSWGQAAAGAGNQRRPQLNLDAMQYTFTRSDVGRGGAHVQQRPQPPQPPSYHIQAPPSVPTPTGQVIPPYNRAGLTAGALTRQVPQPALPRQAAQSMRAQPAPTFKHPNQLEPLYTRGSPPQLAQTGTLQAEGGADTQRAHHHPLTPRPDSTVRKTMAAQGQVLPLSLPQSPHLSVSNTGRMAAPQQQQSHFIQQGPVPVEIVPTPVSMASQVRPLPATPQTPARLSRSNPPTTPEHHEVCSSLPITPSHLTMAATSTSPFDLEKHLQRVRILTKSPGEPQFSTRPMFGSEQTPGNMASTTEESGPPVEDNPFIQSFFPDGRGDGNPFQPSFNSPVIGEASGKSLFGNSASPALGSTGVEGLSFDFSGGGDTPQPPGSMFSLFGGPGASAAATPTNNNNDFSFNFGGSGVSSPQANHSSEFSFF